MSQCGMYMKNGGLERVNAEYGIQADMLVRWWQMYIEHSCMAAYSVIHQTQKTSMESRYDGILLICVTTKVHRNKMNRDTYKIKN